MHQPQISIIAYSGEHTMVHEALAALSAQDAAPETYEVIVIDYNPDCDWPQRREAFTRAHPHLKLNYTQLEGGTRARAINLGVQQATSPIVVLLADDFIPVPGFVAAHLQFHQENPDEESVGIGPGFYPDHLLDSDFRIWLENSGTLFGVSFTTDKRSIPEQFFYVANASLKKSFFLQAGGLDEDFPFAAWDDYELGLRLNAAGMRAQLVSQGHAIHEHPVTLSERSEAMIEAAKSAVIFETKYPGYQPWHTRCAEPSWKHRAKAEYWRLKHLLTRNASDRENYYRKLLDSSFVAAYRTANTR